MSISFKQFSDVVSFVADARHPVMLRAAHGVGKSSVVYAFAKQVKLPVIERRASQMNEGDLLGLPKLNDNKTDWIPPSWLKQACDEPVVLFIDEIDRATTEVRQGFFELCDSRKIAGWHLHKDTLIFAAVNGGEHGAQYQVGEMDPAELDRWTVFDLEPTVEDWLDWAKQDNNIHKVVVNFIRDNHRHLEHNSDFEPNKVYPSRRSWHRLNDTLVKADLIISGETNPKLFNLATAYVGFEAAIAFQDYVKSCKKNVTPKEILVQGNIELVKDFDINEHSALVEKMNDEGWWTKTLTKKQLTNLAVYFKLCPSEVAMVLQKNLADCTTDAVKLKNFSNFYELVKERVIEIMGDK